MTSRPLSLIASALLISAGASCAAPQAEAPKAAAPKPVAETQVAQLSYANFGQWRDAFRVRAMNAGVRAGVFDQAFAGVGVNDRVVELDGRQPEFTRAIWEYLDSAVSKSRIDNGREKAAQHRQTLSAIETTLRCGRRSGCGDLGSRKCIWLQLRINPCDRKPGHAGL